MEFGKKLGLLIKKEGLTNEDFSKQISADATHISRIINGHRFPNFALLEKIVDHFSKTDLNWLLREEYASEVPIARVNENQPGYTTDVMKDIEEIENIIKNLKQKMTQ